jgi:hypothetical protein
VHVAMRAVDVYFTKTVCPAFEHIATAATRAFGMQHGP